MTQELIIALNQAALFSGLVIMAGLIWSKTKTNSGNGFLVSLMAVICIGLLSKSLSQTFYPVAALPFLLADALIFLIGPLVYLSLIKRPEKYFAHFLPALVYALYILFLSLNGNKELVLLVNSPGTVSEVVFPLVYLAATVQTIAYMIMSMRVTKAGDNQKSRLTSMLIGALLFINVFCLAHFLPYLGIPVAAWIASPEIAWLVIVSLVFAMNIHFVTRTITGQDKEKTTTDNNINYAPENAADISLALDRLFQDTTLHRDRELSLTTVSNHLAVSKATLSAVLNAHMQTSFYEYINEKRINDFVQVVHDQKFSHLTYFGIAQEVGFKSKATFYKSFKTVFNTTPKAYFDQSEMAEVPG